MRTLTRLALCLLLAGSAAGLSACAAESPIRYPGLSPVKNLKNRILSREEQDEAIRDLSAEQKQHKGMALREIEKPG